MPAFSGQIEPSQKYLIAYEINDSSDANTYYVRAYIYDADGNAITDNTDNESGYIDLTDNSDQTFSKVFQVPADASGNGKFIRIKKICYTNSGYTTPSSIYGQEVDVLLIKETWNRVYGNRVSREIDYSYITKIIRKELIKQIKAIPKPEMPKIDLVPLLSSMIEIKKKIDSIKIPIPERIDFSPLRTEVFKIQAQINDLPKPEKINLEPIIREIKKAKLDKAEKNIEGIFERIKQFFASDIDEIKSYYQKLSEKMGTIPYLNIQSPKQEESKKKRRGFV